MRVELLKVPCRKCGGALTPDNEYPDEFHWWFKCVNCSCRVKSPKPKRKERT